MINANRGIIYKICNLYCHENEYKQDLFHEIVLQRWKLPQFQERIFKNNVDVSGYAEYRHIQLPKRSKETGDTRKA